MPVVGPRTPPAQMMDHAWATHGQSVCASWTTHACTIDIPPHPMDTPVGHLTYNPRTTHGLPTDTLWLLTDTARTPHSRSMDTPWTPHGHPMDTSWSAHGWPMGYAWVDRECQWAAHVSMGRP